MKMLWYSHTNNSALLPLNFISAHSLMIGSQSWPIQESGGLFGWFRVELIRIEMATELSQVTI